MLVDPLGYRYHFVKANENKSTWRCIERKTLECCKAYALVKDDEIILRTEHKHSAHTKKSLVKKIEEKHVKRAAENPDLPPRSVLRDIANELDHNNVSHLMTKKETVARSIRKVKAKVLDRPPVPTSYNAFFNIPERFTKTADGSEFLRAVEWTEGENSQTLLVFLSDHGKRVLDTCSTWCLDGTFKTSPLLFHQIYFIFGITDTGKTIPACFCLLPNKKCYGTLFSVLKGLLDDATCPEKTMVDFEKGVHNRVVEFFPGVTISGCLFHFKQCVRRNMSERGCLTLYNDDVEFQQLVAMIYCLPFVPPDAVVDTYDSVVKPYFDEHFNVWAENDYEVETLDFMNYFERTFIGQLTRTGRRAALFKVDNWNHYNEVINDDFVTTNNGLESYNSSWTPCIPRNASVWSVIESFQKEDSLSKAWIILL